MKFFLDQVVDEILESNFELDNIIIIVPNNRSILFFKESLKRKINKPIFSPLILSIESFIKDLSGLRLISKTELLFKFFEVYKKNTPENEQDSFDQFLNWGANILQEFNEIDANLVSSKSFFNKNSSIEKINQWGKNPNSDLLKNNLKFNNRLHDFYEMLYADLKKNDKAYRGMLYREALNNLSYYIENNKSHHFFVGFNALNKAEEEIIQEIISVNQASLIWDIDSFFFNDKLHSSSYFIRSYFKKWKSLKKIKKPELTSYFESDKEIEIINTSNNVIQAKCASQILKNLINENSTSSTALVLGEESLLTPVLHCISSFTDDWNVTMGYSLKETEPASFFQQFIELHESYDQEKVFLFKIKSTLEVCSSIDLFTSTRINLINYLQHNEFENRGYIPIKKLLLVTEKDSVGKEFFESFSTVTDFLNRMIRISEISQDYHSLKLDQKSIIIASCFNKFRSVFIELKILQEKNFYIKSLGELKLILESLINNEKINFESDPLNKVQIMGLLETRLLDFDNVIITNLNEGILPAGKINSSIIPFELRKEFDLPTFLEHDMIYSYHFFRLLQRAKKIYLIYNSSSDGLFSGEKSRFLYQLELFKSKNHKISFKQIDFNYTNIKTELKSVFKSDTIYKRLKDFAKEGFSPSSLIQYIRNPYGFYEERLLGIKKIQNFESSINLLAKGTIIHNVLEKLYSPYLNKTLVTDNYSQMIKSLDLNLKNEYHNVFSREKNLLGRNYITYEIIKKLIENFIKEEKNATVRGSKIKIIALEKKFNHSLDLPEYDFQINLKGTVDRIDIYNGSIRVIDYKSGSINKTNLNFNNWESLRTDPNKSALFQVLIYSYVFKNEFLENDVINSGVIPFKNYNNDFMPAYYKNKLGKKELLNLNIDSYLKIENELFSIIHEIFDMNQSFTEIK